MKIGIVCSGALNKGAYEIGCVNAIREYFDADQITYISASSIGSLIAYSYSSQKLNSLSDKWKKIDTLKSGKIFPSYVTDPMVFNDFAALIDEKDELISETFINVLNLSKRTVEYIRLNQLSVESKCDYMLAAMSLPPFSKGVMINNNIMLDAGTVDNIPVFPLLEKNLDFIFCIYFDPHNFMFENYQFDSKIIKIHNFPHTGLLKESFVFDPHKVDFMIEYGYNYTVAKIKDIFTSSDKADILKNIEIDSKKDEGIIIKRLTVDTVISGLNKVTSRIAKRKKFN